MVSAKKRRGRRLTEAEKTAQAAGVDLRNRDVAMADVADPMEVGKLRRSVVNRRECVLDMLLKRKAIDTVQHAAGVAIRMLWERAEIGGARAIDYSRVKVDGAGDPREPVDDAAFAAFKRMKLLRDMIGKTVWPIVVQVACHNRTLADVSTAVGYHHRTVADLLREGLQEAAGHAVLLTLDGRASDVHRG